MFKATGRSWLMTLTGIAQIAILSPLIWLAANHGIAAVAAAQVVEKTLSLAMLGVFVGKVLRHPVVHDLHDGRAASPPLSIAVAAFVYPLTLVLGAGARGLAVESRWVSPSTPFLLRAFVPDVYRIVAAPLLGWRRRH